MIDLRQGPRDQAQRLRQLVQGVAPDRQPKLLGRPGYLREPAEVPVPPARVITVASGKGGVGKTNLVVNLGIALAQRGLRVGILDADLGLANIDIVLGLVPEFNLVHVLRGEKSIQEIMVSGPAGVQVFAGGSGVYELANVAQWHLDRFVEHLRRLDGTMDVCLIDTGAGIGRQVMSFVTAAEEAVIVTTPEPTAVTDAYGLIKMLSLANPQARIRIVVNMVENANEGRVIFERLLTVSARFLGVEVSYLGFVERDPSVARAVRDQVPFIVGSPQTRATQCINRLTDTLLEVQSAPQRAGIRGVFERMLRIAR